MKVNYKSDFDFILTIKDCRGMDIGFPRFDWKAKLYTSRSIHKYEISHIGGVCTNCYNDDGRIHCVVDGHRKNRKPPTQEA